MGVLLCLLFLTWFSSGIVMMYWSYPQLSKADRLNHEPRLEQSKILLSPAQAYAKLQIDGPPDRTRLGTFDGRPVYTFFIDHGQTMVYADDGQELSEFPADTTLRIASTWSGQLPETAKVEENTAEDQWTLAGEFRSLRPLRKYTWPDGEEVYVSSVNGQVVQYTTRFSRIAAYFGAIPHWLYFTPLRKHGQQWSRLVIWASGLGTVAALLGIIVGVWIFSPTRRYRYHGAPSGIPYVGQKRWHAILGLCFGLFACTWAFSGMLSMGPFPQLQEGNSDALDAKLADALQGDAPRLESFDAKTPAQALLQLSPGFRAKELELVSFAGEPFYLASEGAGQTRLIPVHGEPSADFSTDRIVEVLRSAAQPATLTQTRLVTEYEAYYLDRHDRLPLPVLFVQLDDKGRSSYYVDPKTARIVQSYNSSSRWNRWLYHGLHSMDLPWLYKHRPAWDIVVLLLLGGGAGLCVTSLLLAWGVLCRTVGVIADGNSAHVD
jgi:hypothetical protein